MQSDDEVLESTNPPPEKNNSYLLPLKTYGAGKMDEFLLGLRWPIFRIFSEVL